MDKITKLTWIENYDIYYAVSKRLIHILWYDDDLKDWEYESYKKEHEIIKQMINLEESVVERAEGLPDEIKTKEEAFLYVESFLTEDELSEDNVQLTKWITEMINSKIKVLMYAMRKGKK